MLSQTFSNLVTHDRHTTLRSLSISAMSICGLLLVVPVPLKHRALCRLLASWFRDGRTHLVSEDSFSLREHSRTSLTSPSIFFERMVGNTALTRSSTLFLKAMLRQARFNRNIPGPIAERSRNKREESMVIKHTTAIIFFNKKKTFQVV